MKYYLSLLIFFLVFTKTASQELPTSSKIFVRVYDELDNKIAKGKIVAITDRELVLKRFGKEESIPFERIFYLKTKRSDGHNVLVGGALGTTIPLIASATSENKIISVIYVLLTPVFTFAGSGIGYFTSQFKNSKMHYIYYEQKQWLEFKDKMFLRR